MQVNDLHGEVYFRHHFSTESGSSAGNDCKTIPADKCRPGQMFTIGLVVPMARVVDVVVTGLHVKVISVT